VQQSVKQQFEALVDEHSPVLYAQIRSMVLNHEDANDVLQNTWLKAWHAWSGFRGEATSKTWLYRIAYNEALQHLRKQRLRRLFLLKENNRDLSVGLVTDDAAKLLEKALELLSPQQRAVFGMRYYNDLPVRAVAESLKLAEGTVKAVYHQAVKKIENHIKKHSDS
jgi:RNA polymerase sigma-70 factor, ECF subfamily